jgi:transposase InsO family protein
MPRAILADNGSCFAANVFVKFLKERGIQLFHTTPYHPSSNPVERMHREMNRLWRVMCQDHHEKWSCYLEEITLLLNYTITDSLGVAPVQVHLNERQLVPIENLLNIRTNCQADISWTEKLVMVDRRRKGKIQK